MFNRNRISKQVVKQYCSHAGCDVEIETVFVFPAEIYPESAPRMNQRTCTHYLICNLQDKSACTTVINDNLPAKSTKALLDR